MNTLFCAGVGPSSARPSTDQRRASGESLRSAGGESGSTRSRRSSFALERASFDANRSSLEAFGLRNGNRPSGELAEVCHCLSIRDSPLLLVIRNRLRGLLNLLQMHCIIYTGGVEYWGHPARFTCEMQVSVLQGLSKQDTAQAVAALCERAGLPDALRDRYVTLGVVPPDTPLPMNMLKRLWGLNNESDAEATANMFETKVGCSSKEPMLCLGHRMFCCTCSGN